MRIFLKSLALAVSNAPLIKIGKKEVLPKGLSYLKRILFDKIEPTNHKHNKSPKSVGSILSNISK